MDRGSLTTGLPRWLACASGASKTDTVGMENWMVIRLPVVRIEKVEPAVIEKEVPFKAKWTLEANSEDEGNTFHVTFLTDDARLLLCDSLTEESPVEQTFQVQPGARITKETTLLVKLRKGLRNEDSRDGTPAPLTLHARVKCADDVLAFSPGYDVAVANLAKRTKTKIFV
jgi:hypothetical protein